MSTLAVVPALRNVQKASKTWVTTARNQTALWPRNTKKKKFAKRTLKLGSARKLAKSSEKSVQLDGNSLGNLSACLSAESERMTKGIDA